MKRVFCHLPLLIVLGLALLMALHGPIAQLAHYHEFADARFAFGVPNAADVLSNFGFAAVGIWGLLHLRMGRGSGAVGAGYLLFLVALVLTAAGSTYYHLRPDDARLLWDRMPIALACAGLLAAVHGETTKSDAVARNTVLLALAAVLSVVWWHVTGDLRPYLLMQALPLFLIPLWQCLHAAPRADRRAFGLAIVLYILAKIVELNDHTILSMSGIVSGHTVKHLLATTAAAVIVIRLAKRAEVSL